MRRASAIACLQRCYSGIRAGYRARAGPSHGTGSSDAEAGNEGKCIPDTIHMGQPRGDHLEYCRHSTRVRKERIPTLHAQGIFAHFRRM
jgi:hypothetical protein